MLAYSDEMAKTGHMELWVYSMPTLPRPTT